ncbi:protein transport protein bet1 [Entomophthora muscae]|uniref:Protein transport protein bet1 n=2 Tax=Entomophthora muscae TaxID=34485 RepID=A0ACC2SYC5_9FUNG|nr:protein transport protein bet1 [Entomophthora muscae]KAJ9067342.1 protein transport protein bet1 [Entomophthora muscae]
MSSSSKYGPRPSYLGDESSGGQLNQRQSSHRPESPYLLNDEGVGILSQKVNMLKQISIDMGEEIAEGNRELGSMNSDLENISAQIQDTLKRFYRMAEAQLRGGGIYLYLLLFVLAVIVFIVFARR